MMLQGRCQSSNPWRTFLNKQHFTPLFVKIFNWNLLTSDIVIKADIIWNIIRSCNSLNAERNPKSCFIVESSQDCWEIGYWLPDQCHGSRKEKLPKTNLLTTIKVCDIQLSIHQGVTISTSKVFSIFWTNIKIIKFQKAISG